MNKLKIIALVSVISFTSYTATDFELLTSPSLPYTAKKTAGAAIKERLAHTKDTLIQRGKHVATQVSAFFMLWKGDTVQAQQKRAEFYEWLQEKNIWLLHPKKWIVWIITSRMPVKNPDGSIHDEVYAQHYITYKQLRTDHALTEQEKEQAMQEAMDLLQAYRKAKHLL